MSECGLEDSACSVIHNVWWLCSSHRCECKSRYSPSGSLELHTGYASTQKTFRTLLCLACPCGVNHTTRIGLRCVMCCNLTWRDCRWSLGKLCCWTKSSKPCKYLANILSPAPDAAMPGTSDTGVLCRLDDWFVIPASPLSSHTKGRRGWANSPGLLKSVLKRLVRNRNRCAPAPLNRIRFAEEAVPHERSSLAARSLMQTRTSDPRQKVRRSSGDPSVILKSRSPDTGHLYAISQGSVADLQEKLRLVLLISSGCRCILIP